MQKSAKEFSHGLDLKLDASDYVSSMIFLICNLIVLESFHFENKVADKFGNFKAPPLMHFHWTYNHGGRTMHR